jgi:hypothetical protein
MELNFNRLHDDAANISESETVLWKVTPSSSVIFRGVSEERTFSTFKVKRKDKKGIRIP